MVAGVRIAFAVTEPNIVTPSVIVPPDSNTLDAVISPAAFNLKALSDDLISSVLTVNPAMDADTNLANPSASIDDDEFVLVEGAPFTVAGVLKLFTVKPALMVASAPITSESFCGSKWNSDELISMF